MIVIYSKVTNEVQQCRREYFKPSNKHETDIFNQLYTFVLELTLLDKYQKSQRSEFFCANRLSVSSEPQQMQGEIKGYNLLLGFLWSVSLSSHWKQEDLI